MQLERQFFNGIIRCLLFLYRGKMAELREDGLQEALPPRSWQVVFYSVLLYVSSMLPVSPLCQVRRLHGAVRFLQQVHFDSLEASETLALAEALCCALTESLERSTPNGDYQIKSWPDVKTCYVPMSFARPMLAKLNRRTDVVEQQAALEQAAEFISKAERFADEDQISSLRALI